LSHEKTNGGGAGHDGPLMASRRVRLRPIAERDRGFLYELMTSPDSGGRVRFGGATPSPERVAATLWDSVLAQFVIERLESGEPLGLAAITSANFRDGVAYVSALGLPAAQGHGLIAEGALLVFHYAFMTWPLRKIYMETSEDSLRRFGSGLGSFFSEEGRLREHTYWNGRYIDVVIVAVYRATWEQRAGVYLQNWQRPPAGDRRAEHRS
jgi:RimJ/RimL family protein N-acetyltransferase